MRSTSVVPLEQRMERQDGRVRGHCHLQSCDHHSASAPSAVVLLQKMEVHILSNVL